MLFGGVRRAVQRDEPRAPALRHVGEEMPASAACTAWLIRCQFARTPQWVSCSQPDVSSAHSVTAIGPSIAEMISRMGIASAGRERR